MSALIPKANCARIADSFDDLQLKRISDKMTARPRQFRQKDIPGNARLRGSRQLPSTSASRGHTRQLSLVL
jgi:hypothetical protein